MSTTTKTPTTPLNNSKGVPLLEFSFDNSEELKKKELKKNINQYNTLKFGAGYKPRCSDLERWHLYKVNESQFSPTFSCPFQFSSSFGDNITIEKKEDLLFSSSDTNVRFFAFFSFLFILFILFINFIITFCLFCFIFIE